MWVRLGTLAILFPTATVDSLDLFIMHWRIIFAVCAGLLLVTGLNKFGEFIY